MKGPKSCHFRHVHCHFICHSNVIMTRMSIENGADSGVVSAGYFLTRETINTASSLSCRETNLLHFQTLHASVFFIKFHIHLNPIEPIWDLLKRCLRQLRQHRTQARLERDVNQVWRQITQATIQNYIWFMRQRCQAVINANGAILNIRIARIT